MLKLTQNILVMNTFQNVVLATNLLMGGFFTNCRKGNLEDLQFVGRVSGKKLRLVFRNEGDDAITIKYIVSKADIIIQDDILFLTRGEVSILPSTNVVIQLPIDGNKSNYSIHLTDGVEITTEAFGQNA